MKLTVRQDVKIPSRLEVETERAGLINKKENEKKNEAFIIREANASNPLPASSKTSSVPPMTIGKSLLVLKHSHEDDFIKSVVGDTESLARKAFLSLDHHLKQDVSQHNTITITISVLDQVVSNQTQKERSALVLFWWIFMRHPSEFIKAMGSILESVEYDKSTQLSVCLALIRIIPFIMPSDYIICKVTVTILDVIKKLSKINLDEMGYSYSKANTVYGFTEVLQPLSALIQKSNAATRLGVTATNALFSIFSCLDNDNSKPSIPKTTEKKIVEISDIGDRTSQMVIQDFGQSLFLSELKYLLDVLHHIKPWYRTSRALLSAVLSDIANSYESLQLATRESSIIQRSWTMLMPFLNLIPSKRQQQKLATRIQETMNDFKSTAQRDYITYFRFLCMGLYASTLSKKDCVEFFDSTRLELFPVLVNIASDFSRSDETSTYLLRWSLLEIANLLPPTLHYRGNFSPNMLDLFAQVILREDQCNQNGLFDSIAEIITSGSDAIVRMNIINVLIKVLSFGCSNNVKQSILRLMLANLDIVYLLKRIGDENLYSKLDTGLFIPKIVNAIHLYSEPERSTLTSHLINFVRGCDSLAAIHILLEMCRSSSIGTLSPADLAKQKQDPEVILNLIGEIVSQLDKSFWTTGLLNLVQFFLASPQDTVMVKLFVKISNFIGQHLDVILPMLLDTMKNQKGLTEELLLSSKPNNEQILKMLIFERLAPLLILKVVPYTHFCLFWKQSNEASALLASTSEVLLTRMTQVYEFEEVRRVSAQVLSYFPPPVWAVPSLQTLHSALSRSESYTAKICIFTWFSGLSIQGLDLEQYVCYFTSAAMSILFQLPTKGNQEETIKLQKGAVDCLAMMIKAAVTRPKEHIPQQQQLDIPNAPHSPFIPFLQQHLATFDDLLPFIIQLCVPPALLLDKLLAVASQMMVTSTASTLEEQSSMFCRRLLESVSVSAQASGDNSLRVAECALPPLLHSLVEKKIQPSLFTACFQTTVTIVSALKTDVSNFIEILSDFCFYALDSTEQKVAGLKLLTTVSAYDPTILDKRKNGKSIVTKLKIQKKRK